MTPAEIEAFKALCEKSGLIEALDLAVGSIGPPYSLEYLKARQSICDVLARVPALLSALEEATKARSPFDKVGADRLSDEVAVLVRRGIIDARSPAGDALLDYRNPPSTPRADRLASLESALEEARRDSETYRQGLIDWRFRAEAAESRADALQAEVEKETAAHKATTMHLLKVEVERDALQAELESLRAGISYAVKRREEETARADAAWRSGAEVSEAGDALLVGYPITKERNRLLGAIKQFRALPPPSATPAAPCAHPPDRRVGPPGLGFSVCGVCLANIPAPPPSATAAPRVTRAEIEEALRQGGREAKAAEHYRRTGFDDPKLVAQAAPAEEDPARCRLQGGDGDSCAACNDIGTHAPAEEEKCPNCRGSGHGQFEDGGNMHPDHPRYVKCPVCTGRDPSRGEVGK